MKYRRRKFNVDGNEYTVIESIAGGKTIYAHIIAGNNKRHGGLWSSTLTDVPESGNPIDYYVDIVKNENRQIDFPIPYYLANLGICLYNKDGVSRIDDLTRSTLHNIEYELNKMIDGYTQIVGDDRAAEIEKSFSKQTISIIEDKLGGDYMLFKYMRVDSYAYLAVPHFNFKNP